MNTLFCRSLLFGLLLCCNAFVVLSNDEDNVRFKETPNAIKEIVGKIIEDVKSLDERVGYVGTKSKYYRNFILLKKNATIAELVQLADNVNTTVACYAAMALADTSYLRLKEVFEKFIKHDRPIVRRSACSEYEDSISTELYHRYWNRVEHVQNDSLLFQLVVLFYMLIILTGCLFYELWKIGYIQSHINPKFVDWLLKM